MLMQLKHHHVAVVVVPKKLQTMIMWHWAMAVHTEIINPCNTNNSMHIKCINNIHNNRIHRVHQPCQPTQITIINQSDGMSLIRIQWINQKQQQIHNQPIHIIHRLINKIMLDSIHIHQLVHRHHIRPIHRLINRMLDSIHIQ